MKLVITHKINKKSLQEIIEQDCHKDINGCYQCGKCSAGCPIAYRMEYLPHQVVKMIQLDMEDELLASNTPWLCASCISCTTRCPRDIDIAGVMDCLRRRCYKKQIIPSREAEIPLFNKIFLRNIELFARLYEVGLIGMFNLLSGKLFKDFSIVPKMLIKRKIGIIPQKTGNMKEIKRIFAKSGKLEKVRRNRFLYPKLMFLNLFKKIVKKKQEC